MKIGFTGTQIGMTMEQMGEFWHIIREHNLTEFHHGDCVGADEQAHNIVHALFVELLENNNFRGKIIIHPPINSYKRAFCKAKEIRECKDYIPRNHDIVDESDLIIATPKEVDEQLRSGTWATIRYAKKQGKFLIMIFPSGATESHNGY